MFPSTGYCYLVKNGVQKRATMSQWHDAAEFADAVWLEYARSDA